MLTVGLIIAILSFLFHPDVGQFSIMMNGEPVADPLVRFAVIPAFLVIMLITGVLMILLFLGVGVFLFMAAIFIAFAVTCRCRALFLADTAHYFSDNHADVI